MLEVGVSYTVLIGRPETPAGLLAALPSAHPVFGRASYVMRAVMPVNKLVQRLRGNGRITGASAA